MTKVNKKFFIIFGIGIIILIGIILILGIFQSSIKQGLLQRNLSQKQTTFKNFNEALQQLDTPAKLISYLRNNFALVFEMKETPLPPQEFFQLKKGNAWDFAVFVSYILQQNNYDSVIIRYKYDDNKINSVVVFRDKDLPKTIVFFPEIEIYHHGWSFEEMFQKEEQRLGIKITDYALSYWTNKRELFPEKWKKRFKK